jgi:hypothetical protein
MPGKPESGKDGWRMLPLSLHRALHIYDALSSHQLSQLCCVTEMMQLEM